MNCAIPTPFFVGGMGTSATPRTRRRIYPGHTVPQRYQFGKKNLRQRILRQGLACLGGIRREGIGGRGGWAVEGEILGFVVLDSAEESIVVGGALSGDLSQEKIDVARGGDGRAFRGILGGEGSIVALDGRAGGSLYAGAGRKMQGHVRFNVEWGAKLDGRRGAAGRWF